MQRIHAWLKSHQSEFCALLQELVRVDTQNPPGKNYRAMVELLEKKLKGAGFRTQIHRVPDALVKKVAPGCENYPRYNLIGRWNTGAKKTLHFNSHYDVVPVAGQWRFGPFTPSMRNGWLYGRGSNDMKGSIAATLMAMRCIRALKLKPRVNLEVSFTADEETGGELGAGFIVKRGLVKADYCIVCEGGGGKNVGYGHNGVMWFEVAVQGKAAHASIPHKGVNAFEAAAQVALALEPLKAAFKRPRRTFVTEAGKKMAPTINVGGVFSVGPGAKINTVPALATFSIDRRVVLSENCAAAERELLAAIHRAARKAKKAKVSVKRVMRIDPCRVPIGSGHVPAFARAVEAVNGGKAGFNVNSGFTDMHYFAVDGKIPTVGYGPSGKNAHGIDERVKIKSLIDTARVYAQFVGEFAG